MDRQRPAPARRCIVRFLPSPRQGRNFLRRWGADRLISGVPPGLESRLWRLFFGVPCTGESGDSRSGQYMRRERPLSKIRGHCPGVA